MKTHDLRIGFPVTFGHHVGLWGQAVPDLNETVDGLWLRLSGGDLPQPVTVRIDETDDGRFVISGLLIAGADRDEVTWDVLRRIRPATLLAEVFHDFDPDRPRMVDDNGDPDIASVLWMGNRPGGRPRVPTSPGVAPRARVAADLAAFAEAYLRNRARAPHRAMTATANQLHISRATAIRRAQQCRDLGLLPPRED